jgi:transposase
MPNAVVVIDKFHVVRMLYKALEAVCKKVRSELTDRQRRALMHDRYIQLRQKKDLRLEHLITLEAWLAKSPELKDAFRLKEEFYDIWDTAKASAAARRRYAGWQASIPETVAWAFGEMQTSIENWEAEIFAYFDHRITNAYTEALNGVTKTINRIGRGYSSKAFRAKMLLAGKQKSPKKAKVMKKKPETEGIIVSLGVAFEDLLKGYGVPAKQVPGDISTSQARESKR